MSSLSLFDAHDRGGGENKTESPSFFTRARVYDMYCKNADESCVNKREKRLLFFFSLKKKRKNGKKAFIKLHAKRSLFSLSLIKAVWLYFLTAHAWEKREMSSSGATTRAKKRRMGRRDLWDVIVNNDDVCFEHILPRLNRNDVKFLFEVNSETRALVKRSSRRDDLKEGFKVSETSSTSTISKRFSFSNRFGKKENTCHHADFSRYY